MSELFYLNKNNHQHDKMLQGELNKNKINFGVQIFFIPGPVGQPLIQNK